MGFGHNKWMITLTMITLSGFDCTKNCLSNRNLMLDLILFSFRKIWSVPWSLWRTLTLQWQKKVIRYFRQHFCLLLILLKTNSFNPSKGQFYQHFKGRICASRFKLLFEVNGVKVGYNYKVCATVDRGKFCWWKCMAPFTPKAVRQRVWWIWFKNCFFISNVPTKRIQWQNFWFVFQKISKMKQIFSKFFAYIFCLIMFHVWYWEKFLQLKTC